jgi:tubulin polyglutamylase TTLL5
MVYLYEEGLARFATVRYDSSSVHLKDSYMHLTNYSINKTSAHYVACSDDAVEDYGNKWSLGALLTHLAAGGRNVAQLMADIEGLVVKTLMAGEVPINAASRAVGLVPHTCFELFGFDVLVDAELRPWLLEVNLSPSLACEAPLDLKIKGHMLADFFSLGLLPVVDPIEVREPGSMSAAET